MKFFLAKDIELYITQLRAELPHAVLLAGPEGIGLRILANHIAGDQVSGIIEPTDTKGNVDLSTSGVIRVTQIRDLASHAMNKSVLERMYIIDGADQMNHQAQNAFLKLLEEPASHVHFLLLTHHAERILPTILSRVQSIHIPIISREQSEALLDILVVHDASMRTKLLYLAEGLPAELSRLVSDKERFEQKAKVITSARQLLQGTTIEQLRIINSFSGDRAGTLELLTYTERILKHSLSQQPSPALIERAEAISEVYDRIASNGNIRIQLLSLVV